MERSIRKNPFQSVRSLTNKLDIRAGETTVQKTLHQLKYKSRRARVAPPLRQSHKKDLIDFALKHLSESMEWRIVFFRREKI